MEKRLNLTLKVWRQKQGEPGGFKTYQAKDIDENASFLEMLDIVNEQLTLNGEEPIEFEHDCREGICGCCGAVVNGKTHGSHERTTLCQLHMRKFSNNEQIVIEPFRAKPFKVIKDLIVDRSAFDRIIQSGGYVSVSTGSAPDANTTPVPSCAKRSSIARRSGTSPAATSSRRSCATRKSTSTIWKRSWT